MMKKIDNYYSRRIYHQWKGKLDIEKDNTILENFKYNIMIKDDLIIIFFKLYLCNIFSKLFQSKNKINKI